jgi:toxin CptA
MEAWIAGLAGTSIAVALFLPAPAAARAALVSAILAAAIRSAQRHACREGPAALRQLTVDLAGRVEVVGADGSVRSGRLVDGCFVAPWLTIVRWRPEGARLCRTVAIAPDAVDADAFRRLRVLLRWR